MSDVDLKTMKVADLRDALLKRGLDAKGVKAALLKRLKAVLNKEAKEKEKNASHAAFLTDALQKESTDLSGDVISEDSHEADLAESIQSVSVIEKLEKKVTGKNVLGSKKVGCVSDKIVEPSEPQINPEKPPILSTAALKNNDVGCEVFIKVPVHDNVAVKAVNLKEVTKIEKNNKDETVLEGKHDQLSVNRQSNVEDESEQKNSLVPLNEKLVDKRIDVHQDESSKSVQNIDQVLEDSAKETSNPPTNAEESTSANCDTLILHASNDDMESEAIVASDSQPSTNDGRQETVSDKVVTERNQKRKYDDPSSDDPKREKKPRERRTRWSKIEERVEPLIVEMKVEREEINDSVVTLDTYNSDLNLVIEPSRYAASPLTDQGFAFMWAGARATHGVTKGKICYEVLIVKNLDVSHLPEDEPNPHVVRVGFSVESSTLQLGEDPLSYGYGGTGKISTNCQFKDYGSSFSENDVVTAFLNMDANPVEIGFAKNGNFLGWAYKVNKSQLGNQALFPHVLTKNITFEVNFGQREKPYFALRDGFQNYTFIGCVPSELREHGTKPPATREDCEMIMMCGLPGAGKSVWAAEFSKKHPEKKYNVLGTNNIIDKMKVMGLPRKRNYHGRWEVLIQMSTKCLNKLFEIGSKLKRNYILDQTNVYPTAQRKKMRNFEGFRRKAVVVVPTEEEFKRRCDKRDRVEGKEVPEHAVLEMKANFKLPEVCDVFDEVTFTELDRPEAEELVRKYNAEGRAATGPPNKRFRPNDSSPGARNPRNSGEYGGGSRGYRGGGRGGHDGSFGRGGHDSGSFGRGGHDGGSFGRGGHDGGSFGRGGQNSGSFGRGGHDGGSFGRGGHDGGSFGRGGHDSGSFGRGGHDSGSFGRGGHDSGSFGRGGHDSGSFGRGGHDSGSFGRSGQDGGSFGRGGHDGGSFGRGGHDGGSFGRGGQSGGSFGRGGQSGGSFGRGGQNSGSFGRGGQNSGSFGRGGQSSGSFGRGGQNSGSFGRGGQDGGSFGRGGQHSGSFGRGGQDGSFSRGGQSSGSFGRGGHDSGSFDQGSHDSGSYGRGSYGGEQTYGSGYGNNSPSYGDHSPGGFGRGGSRGNYRGGRSQGGYGRDHTYNESGSGQEGGYANDQRGYRGGGGGAGGGFDSYNDNYNKKTGFGNDGSSGGFKKDTGFGNRGGNSGGRGSSRGSSSRGYSGAPNNRGGRNNRGGAGGNKTWSDSRSLQPSSGQSDQSGYGSGYGSTKTENSASSSATGYGNYSQNYNTASYESQSTQAYQQPQTSYSYQPQTNQTTPTAAQQWPASPPAPTVPPPAVAQPTPEQIQQQWTQYYQQQSQQQYYNQYYGGTPAAAGATTTPVYGTGVYAAK